MARPQLAILPGAWHKPEGYFDAVGSRLKDAGFTIHSTQMPSVGNSNPPKDLSKDIAAAQSLVERAIGDGNDVAVIAHSWGGIVAGSALCKYDKTEREAQGKKGGIIAVGYMTAFLLPEGVSLADAVGHEVPPWWDLHEEKGIVFATDSGIFYNDLPLDEQKHWFSLLQSHNIASFYAPTTAASWKELPTYYLACEQDLAIPIQGQDAMIQSARDAGFDVDVTRLNCGHSPFLSMPDETVAWIQKVAGQ